MSEYKNESELIAALGEPALWLDSESFHDKPTREHQDIQDKYAIYFKPEASGGCIVYGLTPRGWVVNPSLRFPVFVLSKLAQRAMKFADAYDKYTGGQRIPNDILPMYDRNTITPAGTVMKDWRLISESVKTISLGEHQPIDTTHNEN